jgi:hypothetical protein
MSEQHFPDAEFELVHKVNHHHSGNVKLFSKPLEEGILFSIQQDTVSWRPRKALTTVGTEDVDLSIPSTPVPATACPSL